VSTQAQPGWSARSGLYFVLLFGAVNLFADMTYEGARSVTGPFLGMLGASGFIVGAVAYWVFGAAFGVAWFAGSAALGALYDVSITAAVALAVITQLLAVVPISIAARSMRID
jgi:hypothetical protein